MKKLLYDDIPKFTGVPNYQVDVSWKYLEATLRDLNVDLDPDFQRAHVWTPDQQRAYIEFRIKGGQSGADVFLNNPVRDFPRGRRDISVVVDGKQRITAVREFMADRLPVFGGYLASEIEGIGRFGTGTRLHFYLNNLKTRAEVLHWYLELNTGGVVHSQEELDRVADLLRAEQRLEESGE